MFGTGDVGVDVEERIDPGLARGGLLDQGGDPADGGEGPGQQVDVEDKLEDVAELQVAIEHPEAPDIDGEDGAQSDQHHDDGHEQGIHLDEVERAGLVQVGFGRKSGFGAGLSAVGDQDANPRIGLLHHRAQQALLRLYRIALLVDACAYEIHGDTHEGQGSE